MEFTAEDEAADAVKLWHKDRDETVGGFSTGGATRGDQLALTMSKSLKKKNHWTNKVHEAVITRGKDGELGFELKGGAENGQFPYFGEVKQGKGLIQSGKLAQDELLLEVNNMPVAGLTTRDVLAVIKHCKDPVRLKCVKQGERRNVEGA